jgi:hypothetical protein
MAADQVHKADAGKLRPSLFPWRAINPVLRVLEFGAKKYAAHGWSGVAADRYVEALLRHVVEWQTRSREEGLLCLDEESGLPTLAHIACNALFLLAHPGVTVSEVVPSPSVLSPSKYYTLVTGDIIEANDEYDQNERHFHVGPTNWVSAEGDSVGRKWNSNFKTYRRKVTQ